MLSFATIGTSWITDSFIASAHATKQWELVAVYSRSLDSARKFAAKYNDATIQNFDSVDALVANASTQAVYIASPNALHYEHAKMCLKGGKHVIMEKPATSSLAQYEELRTLAETNGVFMIEAFRHLHEANFGVLKSAVERLGSIQGASFTYASRSSRYNNVLAGETPNIFSLDFGGGSLVDLGVYPISAAVAIFGKPVSQSYSLTRIRTGVDGGGFIVLDYERFSVQINASKIWTSGCPSEIYGENGTLTFSDFNAIRSITYKDVKGGKEEIAVEMAETNMKEEAAEFARIIREEDRSAVEELHGISEVVLEITQDLRRQNGLLFRGEA